MKKLVSMTMLLVVLAFNSMATAQVKVIRTGSENPMSTIAKSTFYGAMTGVFMGLALSLVVEEDFADIMKWSFVSGTFGGFAIGLYHVASRPQPQSASLLQFNRSGLAKVQMPVPCLSVSRVPYLGEKSMDLRVNVISMSL